MLRVYVLGRLKVWAQSGHGLVTVCAR